MWNSYTGSAHLVHMVWNDFRYTRSLRGFIRVTTFLMVC